MREPQHGVDTIGLDLPGQRRARPFGIVALTVPDNFLAGIKLGDGHPIHGCALVKPELCLATNIRLGMRVGRPPARETGLCGESSIDLLWRGFDVDLML